MKYVVMCYRSSESRLGGACAPMREDGKVKVFATHDEVAAVAMRLNAQIITPNVFYAAEELVT